MITHIEFLLEEPSAEAFLSSLLVRNLSDRITFSLHVHQGKRDLLAKLAKRLRGYARWLPETSRIIVLVDRDKDDCIVLKRELEHLAAQAGLRTRTVDCALTCQVVNRIACEELEAWFFGDHAAIRTAYPRVSLHSLGKAAFRNPDLIAGGTWEALERTLKAAGYFSAGLRKVECAQLIGQHLDPTTCSSASFKIFWEAILEAMTVT
jgi:hypothetical protein